MDPPKDFTEEASVLPATASISPSASSSSLSSKSSSVLRAEAPEFKMLPEDQMEEPLSDGVEVQDLKAQIDSLNFRLNGRDLHIKELNKGHKIILNSIQSQVDKTREDTLAEAKVHLDAELEIRQSRLREFESRLEKLLEMLQVLQTVMVQMEVAHKQEMADLQAQNSVLMLEKDDTIKQLLAVTCDHIRLVGLLQQAAGNTTSLQHSVAQIRRGAKKMDVRAEIRLIEAENEKLRAMLPATEIQHSRIGASGVALLAMILVLVTLTWALSAN